MSTVVAFHVPHNEGSVAGFITGPGFESEHTLVDLYEVDASMASFASMEEAEGWMEEYTDEGDPDFKEVTGGFLRIKKYEDD